MNESLEISSNITSSDGHELAQVYRHVHLLERSEAYRGVGREKLIRRALNPPATLDPICDGYRDFSNVSIEDVVRFAASATLEPTHYFDDVTVEPNLQQGSFPMRLHAVLSNKAAGQVMFWKSHGRSFRVMAPKVAERTCESLLGIRRYPQFLKILASWGFRQIKFGPDRGDFYHEAFLFGMPHLTCFMGRTKCLLRHSKNRILDPNLQELHLRSPLPRLPTAEHNLKRKVVGSDNLEKKECKIKCFKSLKSSSSEVLLSGGVVLDTDDHINCKAMDSADNEASLKPQEGSRGDFEPSTCCTLSMSSRLWNVKGLFTLEDTARIVSRHIENIVSSFLNPESNVHAAEEDRQRRLQMAKLLHEILCSEAMKLDTPCGDAIAMMEKLNKASRSLKLQYYNMCFNAKKDSQLLSIKKSCDEDTVGRSVRWDESKRVRLFDPNIY